MLITAHLDLVASGLRNVIKPNMQNHRPASSNSVTTKTSAGSTGLLQSRPATDFSIEAIMGRSSSESERRSPKIALNPDGSPNSKSSGGPGGSNSITNSSSSNNNNSNSTTISSSNNNNSRLLPPGGQYSFSVLNRDPGSQLQNQISPSNSRTELVSPSVSPGLEEYNHTGLGSRSSMTLTNPRSPMESCDGSRSPTNSEITAGSMEGDPIRPRSGSPIRSTPSPSNSNCSTKEANNPSSSGPNPFAEALKPRCNCEELSRVDCHLENKDLWDKFNELGTEMIITKSGRRMFPTVRVSFSGIELDSRYIVLLDIVPVDNKRYRYAYHRSSWLVAGKADPPSPARLYVHPDAPFSGDQLRKQVVSFEKVKLTNNEMDKQGHIVLNSMHRYQPRIHLVIRRDPSTANAPVTDLESEHYRSYVFPETIFTAVTAYQNQLITKLKIDSNPFAKGFRDSSRLTDLERETMENLMSDPCSYPRTPMISPFLLNGDDPTTILLRERAALLGIQAGGPGAPGAPNMARPPVMWRPHPAFSQLNPSEVYSLLAATASCPPSWYSAAIGAHFRGPPPPPTSSVAALAFTASPQFWSANPQLPHELSRQGALIPSTAASAMGAAAAAAAAARSQLHAAEAASAAALHRYAPYLYSSPKKELTNNGSGGLQNQLEPGTSPTPNNLGLHDVNR